MATTRGQAPTIAAAAGAAVNILRSICTASYRIAVLSLLLLILSTQTMANKYLFAIGSMIFKVVGGPAT